MSHSPPTPPASPKCLGPCSPPVRLGQILSNWIRLSGILGVGAYGTVYQAEDVNTNARYAVKALEKAGLDPRQKQFQEREISLHHQASQHPNVVRMEKILDTADCTFVVLEFCPEGDLFTRITDEGDYIGNDQKAKQVFLQILDAVRHCHSKGIYHRDLKPENILVKDNGWTVKLADFGLATQDRITSDFGCGSTFYMSPECEQSYPQPYACYASVPNDIWSLGVILVNLTCGRNPWKRACMDDSTFRAFRKDRNFLQSILPISDELNDILCRIFETDPKRRISLAHLRERILRCPQLSRQSFDSLPPTPPKTPVDSPIDPAMMPTPSADDSFSSIDFDPLPAQEYPSFSSVPYGSNTFHNHPFTSPGLDQYPRASNGQFCRQVDHVAASAGVYPGQAGFIPSFQWPNFMPTFAHPSCWRNVPML